MSIYDGTIYEFSNGNKIEQVLGWKIKYKSTDYGTDINTWTEAEIPDDLISRACMQYDSPLVGLEPIAGYKILSYESSISVLKIFKPIGAYYIELKCSFTESGTQKENIVKINLSDDKVSLIYSLLTVTIALKETDSFPEVYEHTSTDASQKVEPFRIKSHEFQVNGSNFNVSRNDYLDRNKINFNNIMVRAIPDFGNVAMTRTFQKFIIGGYNV